MTGLTLAARLRNHVFDRGGVSCDENGRPVAPNGAWSMMLEAANVLEATYHGRAPVAVDYVFASDWCGLYANGELVMEGHSMSALDVLEWVRGDSIAIESVASMQADDDWLEERGDLPKHYRDVKAKECGRGNHD